MRWDRLFDDLESQLEHGLDAEESDLELEEHRLRFARLEFRDRLRSFGSAALAGAPEVEPLQLALLSGERLAMRVTAIGRDWVAGESATSSARRRALVPLRAIASVVTSAAMRDDLVLPEPSFSDRLGLAFALRDLSRRRTAVEVVTVAGRHAGTIDRVARDHFDLAEHELDEPRRPSAVRAILVVPFAGLVAVRY